MLDKTVMLYCKQCLYNKMSASSVVSDSEKPKQKSRNILPVLFSCCLFLAIACACLLTALVLIGRHIIHNSAPRNLKFNTKPIPKAFSSRLPNDTIPLHYDVTLKPNLESGNYFGSVNITVNVTQSRKEIVIHGKNLNIETVELMRVNDSKVFDIRNVQEIAADEVLIIFPKNVITRGLYYLYFRFSGSMLNKTTGFYRSYYQDNSTEEKRYMATSKFEPTYARQAFPCFDEPNLKATYKVHLLKPNDADYIALSNYPVANQELANDGTLVHFEETVPMSTYLSCFIVSDFKSSDVVYFENAGERIPFKVYASPGQLEKTSYAAQVGREIIEYYVTYFSIPYPLPKLDMVAIPDFVSGAMEHWGLVTYRETALLYHEQTHSTSNKQRVAEVVAHELAHSWFGNLVTMDWWNDLWLNEGFASYIQYKGVHAAESEWKMMEQFLISDLHPVLSLDATQGSHPIIQSVTTPDQITEVFDTISYSKGASVLRMLESVVGENNFKQGVTNYLNKHKYGNAVTQNLWDEIQKVVGNSVDVTEFMNTFTMQMGYPILTIKVEGNRYRLTQKRFLKDPETAGQDPESPFGYKWNIPVTYADNIGDPQKLVWFNHNETELVIEKPGHVRWLKFNPGQVGYYRVNYDRDSWSLLGDSYFDFSEVDRTHLLEESFSIAETGELSYEVPLTITLSLENEYYYIVWSVASSKLQQLGSYMQNSLRLTEFQKYVHRLFRYAYDRYGWDEMPTNETHTSKLVRVVILNLACAMNFPQALEEANKRFNTWLSDTSKPLDPDLKTIIYKYGMVNAGDDVWESVFYNIFAREQDANEKLKLMNGLAMVKNPVLLTRLIELAKDETYVRSQDYFTLLQYISSNPIGAPIVWDYVREHWLDLVKRFTLNDRYLGRLIPSITNKFLTRTKAEEMEQFFKKYPEAGAGAAARRQALETVDNNIKWIEKYQKVVGEWVSQIHT